MPRGHHVSSATDVVATRSDKFWYSDGSIVLLAQSTMFKVHSTLLYQCSTAFTTIIQSLATDGQYALVVDGCPCLRLEDTADDVANLLSAIYHPLYFDSISSRDASLGKVVDLVGGILRMSTKYDITHLRSKCISLLSSDIESTLPFYNVFPNPFAFRDLVSAINLAEETHIPGILTPLYYSMTGHYPIDCAELTWKTRAVCMSGGFALLSLFRTKTHSFLFDFQKSKYCTSNCDYHSGINDIQAAHKAYLHAGVLRPIDEDDLEKMNICGDCEAKVLILNTAAREYVILRLPELFGLIPPLIDDVEIEDAGNLVQEPTLQPHTEFWYEDGSIVLIVGQTMYLVHRSRLVHSSEVFADMFDLPNSQNMDLVHGRPSVVLHDDAADFTLLLRALEVPMYFEDYPSTSTLACLMTVIPGILRLSTKYNIYSIRQKCICLLSAKFVTTLSDYDIITGTNEVYEDRDVISAINLAELTNIPEILPHALCIMTDRASTYDLSLPTHEHQLSWRAKAMCMSARQKSMWAFYNTTHPFLFKFKREEYCASNCRYRTRPQDLERLWGDKMGPLLARMHDMHWNTMNLCSRCRVSLQKQHTKGRNIIWDQLPRLFGYGGWEEIKKIQDLN